jgi:predicted transcriptional regulator
MGKIKPNRLWKGEIAIIQLLRDKELTWTEIRNETHLNTTTLSEYLQDLQEKDWIVRKKVEGQAQWKYTTYRHAYEGLDLKLIHSITLSDEPRSIKDFISALPPTTDTKRFEEEAIRANASLVTASIPALLYDSLRAGRNSDQRINELIDIYIRPQLSNLLRICLLNRKLAEGVTEKMRDTSFNQAEKEFDKFNAMWKALQPS